MERPFASPRTSSALGVAHVSAKPIQAGFQKPLGQHSEHREGRVCCSTWHPGRSLPPPHGDRGFSPVLPWMLQGHTDCLTLHWRELPNSILQRGQM